MPEVDCTPSQPRADRALRVWTESPPLWTGGHDLRTESPPGMDCEATQLVPATGPLKEPLEHGPLPAEGAL